MLMRAQSGHSLQSGITLNGYILRCCTFYRASCDQAVPDINEETAYLHRFEEIPTFSGDLLEHSHSKSVM